MNGGFSKTASRIAIAAVAAGAFAAGASAADLGGNCCADLEERVAELEKTTARKGNRNVSLTVYGHVNEMIMFWDDGVESNAYVGTNDDSRSRFGFRGTARINSDWSAGYVMEFGLRTTRSDRWTQTYADGGDPAFDVRKSAWYLNSKTFGRVTVGRESTVAGNIQSINLANINAPRFDDFNNRMLIRNEAGAFIPGARYDRTVPLTGYDAPKISRVNGVRYDSPTFAGFKASAQWGQDDFWSVALRYAAQFGGFRLAAGAGYQWHNQNGLANGCTAVGGSVDCEGWNVGASVMHTQTGLFASGGYGQITDNFRSAARVSDTDSSWVVTAGIEQKWFALGRTTIYATYYKGENNDGFASAGAVGGRIDAGENDMWSIGVNQRIDSAAMDLYLAYYNSSASLTDDGVDIPTQEFQAVIAGAKIRF